jgi:hypothetical protein
VADNRLDIFVNGSLTSPAFTFSVPGGSLHHALINADHPGGHEEPMPSGKPGMTGGPGGDAPGSSLLLAGAGRPLPAPPAARGSLIEVTVPVYNEEKVLAASVRRLH